jgi:hypothetical protein
VKSVERFQGGEGFKLNTRIKFEGAESVKESWFWWWAREGRNGVNKSEDQKLKPAVRREWKSVIVSPAAASR